MIEMILKFFSHYLIEFMGLMLCLGLVFRYLAFRQSKNDGAYFSSFAREVQAQITKDRENEVTIHEPERYISELLGKVNSKLPQRSLRFKNKASSTKSGRKEFVTLRDFVDSKEGLVSTIQAESSVFANKNQPNFFELTHRVMGQDRHWNKLLGHIPIEGVGRMIDILPSLFIVFGVFGTFIGISMALPEIANIDFNDLEGSQETLTSFVLNVTFAMRTSIAGIFFSLILTFLNTLFPIKDVRYRIFKSVENCFHQLWYHVQRGSEDGQNIKSIMSEMLNELKELNQKQKRNDSPKKAG